MQNPVNDNLEEQNAKNYFTNKPGQMYMLWAEIVAKQDCKYCKPDAGLCDVISNYGSHTNTSANPVGALAEAQKLAFIINICIK
jgi:hypothetical protein